MHFAERHPTAAMQPTSALHILCMCRYCYYYYFFFFATRDRRTKHSNHNFLFSTRCSAASLKYIYMYNTSFKLIKQYTGENYPRATRNIRACFIVERFSGTGVCVCVCLFVLLHSCGVKTMRRRFFTKCACTQNTECWLAILRRVVGCRIPTRGGAYDDRWCVRGIGFESVPVCT